MGKRKSSSATKAKKTGGAGYAPYQNTSTTLREESSGKKKQKPVNAKSMLKLDHIKNLALWTKGEEEASSIPSLGAFFGNRLAQTIEALSVPPDPNLFSCQRCESILQPGVNCTIRIEKKKTAKPRKKSNRGTQNNVVYTCHFCTHRNLKRGTPKNYMKEICIQKPKKPRSKKVPKTDEVLTESSKDGPVSAQEKVIDEEPSTPVITRQANNSNSTLLELRSKKRNRSGLRKTMESAAIIDTAMSSKRKRKSWTSLKEIAERSSSGGQDDTKSFSNLKIPFFI